MPQSWFWLESEPSFGAENMALDEALFETVPLLDTPLLRFYGWRETAATFGYSQHYAEIARLTHLRPLIRRPTGGGLVSHEADWTYTLIFPSTARWYALKAAESYERLHQWIQAAFARCRLETELSPTRRREVAGQCFVGAEQFDLLWRGQKIAGAAQRRTKQGLLIQGSIQPPKMIVRTEWQARLFECAQADWGAIWTKFTPAPEVFERAAFLAQHKYGRPEYNERR